MARHGDGIYLRGRTWWLDFRHDGERHVVRIGKNINRTSAREIAQVKRAQILKGAAGIGRKRKDITFEKAVEHFLAWGETNKRPHTVTFYRTCLARLGEAFGGRRLSQIHKFHVETYKQQRSKGGARVRVNRELATLKNMFNRCIEWKKFEGENPVKGVEYLKESKGKLRFLDADEEKRLLGVCAEPLRTVILLGIHTGIRIQSEALTLRWGAIDLLRELNRPGFPGDSNS